MNEDEIQNFRFLFTLIYFFLISANLFIFRISSSAKIYVITDKGILTQNSELKRIYDILELDSYILVVGEGSKIYSLNIIILNRLY